MSNLLLGLIGGALMFLLLFLTIICPVDIIQKYRAKTINVMMWSSVISFFDESYIILSVSCFASLGALTFDQFSTTFSSTLGVCSIFVIVGFPILNTIFIYKKRDELDDLEVKQKFGPFFEQLDLKDLKMANLFAPTISILRRLGISLSLVFLLWSHYFQIMTQMYLMVAMVIYVGQTRPYDSPLENNLDIFNEVFIALLIYTLICFADLVQEPSALPPIGWFMIGVIVVNITINFSIMIYKSVRKFYFACRLKLAKRRLKKRMA
jgi:hypothetical protein